MNSTRDRFKKGDSCREIKMFRRIIRQLDAAQGFYGINAKIHTVVPKTSVNALYDLSVISASHSLPLKFELQETTSSDWNRYGDIRLDLCSAYSPYKKYYAIDAFRQAIKKGEISWQKNGKLLESEADILLFYVYQLSTDFISNIHLLNWKKAQREVYREYIIKNGIFKTNTKTGETWGSAFISVKPEILADVEIKSLNELYNMQRESIN